MGLVKYAERDHLDPAAKAAWDEQQAKSGFVTNMKKTLLHSLPTYRAYQEWYPVSLEAAAVVGKRGVVLLSHAISTANACLLCSTYFRKDLRDLGEDPDALVLSERDTLIVDFGRAVARRAADVPPELLGRLQAAFTDRELVILTGFAGLMIATNVFNNVLKVDLDGHLQAFQIQALEPAHG